METNNNGRSKTSLKLAGGVVAIIILLVCLIITSYAIVYASVTVENNIFNTGIVDINLNDGEAIIDPSEFLFEPGMTVVKDFFVENNSTWAVWYKVYFTDTYGELAEYLDITLMDDGQVLYSGKASDFNRENTGASIEELQVGEKRWLTVYFHFPEDIGNEAQNLNLYFDLCAEAVQTKNNPEKLFD